jgi:two-component system LytT family response regulator
MNSKLNCIIIDDEKHAADLLADYIDAMPDLHLLKSFTDPLKALIEITAEDKVDILFMDVDMPGMTGLDLSQAIRFKTKYLVFTSAHSKYAIDAFGVQVNEYLLKPISMSKFALTVNRLLQSDTRFKNEEKQVDYFFIRADQSQKYVKINLKDLIAVEALNNYVKIHTINGIYVTYLTIKEVAEKLDGNSSFMRVQRSFIIAMDFISKVEGACITLSNKLEVPLGTTYKKQFLTFLEEKTLRTVRGIPN